MISKSQKLQLIFQKLSSIQMSFILQNQFDQAYVLKLCQQIKLIKQSKMDWTVEHVLRFASLIKVEDSIQDIILSWEIDGSKLFDIEYLGANLGCVVTDRNYMPLYKLFYVVNAILQATESIDKEEKEDNKREELENKVLEQTEIDIAQQTIIQVKEELNKLNSINIIQLGSTQLARILNNIHMREESESVKKWGIDGFTLLCIIGNESESQTYKNYYSDEDLRLLNRLSQLFVHLYYSQHSYKGLAAQPTIDDFGVEFNQLNFDQNRSFHSSQYGVSEPGDIKQEDQVYFPPEAMRNSQYGESVRNSEYGASVRGSLAASEPGSQRGSTRGSMAESSYASSQIMEEDTIHNSNQKQTALIAVSSIEDYSIATALMEVALQLPFNLLNLEPLQRIKICSIPYPFNLNKANNARKGSFKDIVQIIPLDNVSQKPQTIYDLIDEDEQIRQFKIFNLTGAKFGRNSQNDFSYPDELSISGKHAQIVFKDESYYLRDLGSKTGTFLYISEKKPLTLSDEQLVQLSYEVEFKVMIIKNDVNEGVIKFQFKKPENEPPYRAILKNNNTVRIGKADNSHIKLNNQSISSYHAQIKYQQGKFVMYDCNTRTGTWLRLSSKGVRSADRKLSKLDIIRISSKKTFLIQDMTEGIEFASCSEANKGKWDAR